LNEGVAWRLQRPAALDRRRTVLRFEWLAYGTGPALVFPARLSARDPPRAR
jgi:hypothetical protein